MNHGCVTLDEIFAAAAARGASLVPETSGYLALAVGDATSRLPFAIDDTRVMLTTEGNVGITKRGEILSPPAAARGLRDILARLLAVSTGTGMPSLSAAARTRDESERGVDAVVEEIEAALIPVNRAAARRALARLARETIKAKEQGRLKKPSVRPKPMAEAAKPEPVKAPEPVQAPEPAPVVEVAKPKTPAPPVVVAAKPKTPAPPVVEPAAAPILGNGRAWGASVVTEATTPPPPDPVIEVFEEHDPTPTILGMAPVEEIDPHAEPAIEAAPVIPVEAEEPQVIEPPLVEITLDTAPAPAATLSESVVLAQPSEAPELAFHIRRVDRPLEAITPPFALDMAPPPPAAPREVTPPPRAVVEPVAARSFVAEPAAPTRADDLLARFGASCVDETAMRETSVCLRRIAGIEATPPPPPPKHVEIRVSAAPLPQAPAVTAEADDWEPPSARRRPKKRGGVSLGLTLAVLIAGVAGGGAIARLRPDLFVVPAHNAPAPAAQPAPLKNDVPGDPAGTAQPSGATAPGWTGHLGGTRAERGTEQRQR